MKKKRTVVSLSGIGAVFCALMMLAGCATTRPAAAEADYDVIIIGAGLGGLSAGAHLALNNLRVLVLEQHDKVGGCATSFQRGEFTFDASLHEMAGGGAGKKDRGLYQLLKVTGVDKKVELYELPQFYRSVFPGVDVDLPSNWEGFKTALKDTWPEESDGIEKFHRICSDTMDDLMSLKDLFRYTGARAFMVKAMVPLRQRSFFKYKDKTVQDVLDECFVSEEIKAVVSQLWVYYGAPVPDQSALVFLAATESYLGDGVWHIKGTSQALANGYAERISELGGRIETGTLVTRVIMKDGIAAGVKTATGRTYTGRYIIANTDPYQLTFKLIGEKYFPRDYVKRLNEFKPANSLFGVYMGLNIDLKDFGYDDSEIFYSTTSDSGVLYDRMMKGEYSDGAVAITIYSNYGDSIYAPPGKSLVTLTGYSDFGMWPSDTKEYRALKDRKVDELISLAARVIPELADPGYVEIKEGFTPRTLKRFTMNRGGVVYGFYLSPQQWQKVPNDTPISNVYITSNWSQAWHGMGSAQVNGWRAARLILDREGIK
ncbi:MAG: NAD(P)/FAD-dependent oxidoreductase [Deltaproteobacteria bacterium]|nr:NAD(P)/FAD-dependent oxidoreductase [Deltaproteobacteria bacterium]